MLFIPIKLAVFYVNGTIIVKINSYLFGICLFI